MRYQLEHHECVAQRSLSHNVLERTYVCAAPALHIRNHTLYIYDRFYMELEVTLTITIDNHPSFTLYINPYTLPSLTSIVHTDVFEPLHHPSQLSQSLLSTILAFSDDYYANQCPIWDDRRQQAWQYLHASIVPRFIAQCETIYLPYSTPNVV